MKTITTVDPSKFITPHDSLCAESKTHAFEGCVAWCPVLVTAHEAKVRGVIPHVGERAQIMAEAVLNVSERLRRTEMPTPIAMTTPELKRIADSLRPAPPTYGEPAACGRRCDRDSTAPRHCCLVRGHDGECM